MACDSPTEVGGDMDKITSVEPLELPIEFHGAFEESANITDLPGVLVSAILTRMSNPIDVAHAFVASRVFWSVAKTSPFRLQLRPKRSDEAHTREIWTRSAVAGIRRTMSSTQELDLSGCPLLDSDIAPLLVDLSSLERLILDDCQKLTAASSANPLTKAVRSGLHSLSLQRCFRFRDPAAGELFASTTAVGSRLETLLLQEFDKINLPHDFPIPESLEAGQGKMSSASMEQLVKNVVSKVPGSSLRILALQKCYNLQVSELFVIGETCSLVEILMLGGSILVEYTSNKSQVTVDLRTASSTLVMIANRLHCLRILEMTFFQRPVFNTVRGRISPSIQVWDFCEKNSVMAAVRMVARLKGCSMPLVSEEDASFLDWCIDKDIDMDHDYYNLYPWMVEIKPEFLGECSIDDIRWDLATSDLLMALKAGANLCNGAGKTPLHMACARGDIDRVIKLFFIGASIGKSTGEVRDYHGDTVLMRAAENGNGKVCDLLLKAGADVLAKNSRTKATPLYTALSLGNTAALEVMIAHCKEHGIDWQEHHTVCARDSFQRHIIVPKFVSSYEQSLGAVGKKCKAKILKSN
ncbi:hypothetical protein R1sor_011869 [Riccia sorocarpa]|uniref:Uncharacterized protein n=1 Tax=Riccia sorocarpa TaxID=122646 RepID=A0ABD3I2J0_9MARC